LLDLVIDIVGCDERLEIDADPCQPIRRVRDTFDDLAHRADRGFDKHAIVSETQGRIDHRAPLEERLAERDRQPFVDDRGVSQSVGEAAPGGGGGELRPIKANIRPTRCSGGQVANATLPLGFSTRRISATVTSGRGANM
jgi:hypothetical protein